MLAVRSNRGRDAGASVHACCRMRSAFSSNAMSLCAERVVEQLTAAILDVVELYCSTFNANFHTAQQSSCPTTPVQEAAFLSSLVSFNVYAAHRIPITWATR